MAKANKRKEKELMRTPIVTILGHVDHGKTTILDQIRKSNVQEKEAGGITQKISVFTIEHEQLLASDAQLTKITFVDTPGHEAFDLMRQRGGDIADIVLLVVAADDGIKPQTEESIEIINKASAKPIVVINKVDLPNVNSDAIKRSLSTKGIQVEGYGGDVPVVEVSGKSGDGIDKLLDTIALVVDVEGLTDKGKLPDGTSGKAFVLESVKDPSKGNISTVIVTQGQMNKGENIAFLKGNEVFIEKIKGFVSETNDSIPILESGHGGRILGISNLLDLGEMVFGVEKRNKKIASSLFTVAEVEIPPVEEEELGEDEQPAWFSEMFAGNGDQEEETEEKKSLNILVKSSSEGSLQALLNSIEKVDVEGFKANVVASGVGNISLKDIEMAEVTKSIILAFESTATGSVKKEAEKRKVVVREYSIIYKLIEEITDVLSVMATPAETEEDLGDAEVREIFTLTNGNMVLGGRVTNGSIKKNTKCYIVRDDEILSEGKITSLKHNKNEIVEAQKGSDFGAIITPTPKDAEVGDQIFCVKVIK